MPNPAAHRLARVASIVILLAPRDFRATYGPEIVATFALALARECEARGRTAMLRLWLLGIADAFRTVWHERGLKSGVPRRGALADLGGDVRQVLRSWRREPGTTGVILLTLTLTIGLLGGVLSFADGYLFRPLPFPDSDRLYRVQDPQAQPAMMRASEAAMLRQSPVGHFGFVEWSISQRVFGEWESNGQRVEVFAYDVSPGFRQTVALPLIAGRDFTPDEHREGSPLVAWLSYRFWKRAFGGSRDAVGQRLLVDYKGTMTQVTVVGILGPTVSSFDLNNRPPDIVTPGVPPTEFGPNRRAVPVVRVPRNMTPDQVAERIAAVLQAETPAPDGKIRAVRLQSLRDYQVRGGRPTAVVFTLGAMLVFGLGAINLIHLLLVRGEARADETATRAALGASRWRICRLFLVESVIMGAVGVSLGLLVGLGLSTVIASQVPQYPSSFRNLALVPVIFDARVMLACAGLGGLLAVVGAGWPAWRSVRRPVSWSARRQTGAPGSVSSRLSRVILATEVAVATVIMAGTAFIGVGIFGYLHQPLGFDVEDRYRIGVEHADGSAPSASELAQALEALRLTPGIVAAGPWDLQDRGRVEAVEGSDAVENVSARGIWPGHFEAWNLRLVEGRWFRPDEFHEQAPVAVVNTVMARSLWPGHHPLGRRIRVADTIREVVGVIEPRRYMLDSDPAPSALVPTRETSVFGHLMVAWAPQVPPNDVHHQVTAALTPTFPGGEIRVTPVVFDDLFMRSVGEARFQVPVMAAFGVLAFVIAAVGIFGVVSYVVQRRLHEFGIRAALGARPRHLGRAVIRLSIVPSCVGLLAGLAGARGLESVIEATAFGWQSSGLGTTGVVSVALLTIAVTASWLPARRAMRVDPAIVLRSE